MKKALLAIVILTVIVTLGTGACKKKQEPAPAAAAATTPTAPPPTTPTAAPPAAPAAVPSKAVPVEDYWTIQFERLESIKKNYEQILVIYEKYKGATPEAQKEVLELQKANRNNMQEIFKSHGYSSTDFYPRGPDRSEVMQQRQKYLQEHADLKEKYTALAKTIRDLRDKVKAFTGLESPGVPGASAPTPPGAPMAPPAPAPNSPAPVPVPIMFPPASAPAQPR